MARDKRITVKDSTMGFAMFVAYFGALVYFVERNEGFWGVVLAFLQAAVWPAYVLHAVLKLLQV